MGIGDNIMASGAAREARKNDPRKVRIMLGQRFIYDDIWRWNPNIQQPGEACDVQILYGRDPITNMRPYHKRKSEERWTYNLDFRPILGDIYLTQGEENFAAQHHPDVIIEPHIKSGASPNKQWGNHHWQEFVLLAKREGIRLSHMGPIGTRPLQYVELITTPTFRCAVAVMKNAKAVVLHEGGLHHAAAAINKPGVVIFGGFTPIELTGYACHHNLGVSLGDACGMRHPCKHCEAEMAKITPDEVLHKLKEVLNERRA